MIRAMVILGLLLSFSAGAAESKDFFVGLRGGLSDGSAVYQGSGVQTAGGTGELTMGWRPWRLLKAGLAGLYESLLVSNGGTSQGRLNLTEYGGSLRFFFLPVIFIEGGGGVFQGNLDNPSTSTNLVANGNFYYLGSGLEMSLNSQFGLEFGLRYRNILFPKNEFQNMVGMFYTAGIDIYF